jgi:hypothetical protein
MRYMLLLYSDESSWADYTPEQLDASFKAHGEYGKWLADKGWAAGGEPLRGTDQATTVRITGGKTVTTDGPFAETKEQLGGYYIVDCENLDQAIEAATKCPSANGGSVEVRPIAPM